MESPSRPWEIFCTRHLIRKDRSQKIFRIHALQLRRNLATTTTPQHSERTSHIPAPANIPHRRIKQSLAQKLSTVLEFR